MFQPQVSKLYIGTPAPKPSIARKNKEKNIECKLQLQLMCCYDNQGKKAHECHYCGAEMLNSKP